MLIAGQPAPILYASKNQINAVVPFAAPFEGNVTVAIIRPGVTIGSLTTTAVASAPGIFSLDGTGVGQGAIFNQDGTLNTRDNPALAGSLVTIYVTGLGPLAPSPMDGSIPTAPTVKAALPVQVYMPAPFDVSYAGDAPGEVEGVQQIKIQIPGGGSNATPQTYPLHIVVAGSSVTNISNELLVSYY